MTELADIIMSPEQVIILEAFERVYSDYESSFTVSVDKPDCEDCDHYVEVIYQWGDTKSHYYFSCRLDGTDVEFCVYEDTYESVSKENIFTNMWFSEWQERVSQ